MGAALRLREDYGADDLRGFACKVRDGAQARRLMALAAVADGKRRSGAAAFGLMPSQSYGAVLGAIEAGAICDLA